MKHYIKHVYWLTAEEEVRLRRKMDRSHIHLRSAKGVVCTPLDEINKISSVSPEIWNQNCARQGSWYRASKKNGLYLIVSSFELEDFRAKRVAKITRSDFIPPRFADEDEKRDMIRDQDFIRKTPPEWGNIPDVEKRIYLRWAKRLGSDVEEYDFLFLSHTANHANFMKPRFFLRERDTMIPYSIDRSAHLCSCCLELFQILGEEYPKKLVAPCPGATIFARLTQDEYLLVERP
jgi:hypothetical protein